MAISKGEAVGSAWLRMCWVGCCRTGDSALIGDLTTFVDVMDNLGASLTSGLSAILETCLLRFRLTLILDFVSNACAPPDRRVT